MYNQHFVTSGLRGLLTLVLAVFAICATPALASAHTAPDNIALTDATSTFVTSTFVTSADTPSAVAATTITVDRSDDPDADSLNKTCGYSSNPYIAADDGCSLRRALIEAGVRPASDRPIAIEFNLASDDAGYDANTDTWTLTVDEPLALKPFSILDKDGQVTLDGSTQPGGRDTGLKVFLDTNDNRLDIEMENNVIRNLGFFGGGVIFLKEDGNTVEGLWMGLSLDGQSIVLRDPDNPQRMAGGGVHMSSDNNIVQGNVIAGSYAMAINVDGSDNNVIQNNAIGTRADETVPEVPEAIECLRSFNYDPQNWYGGWGISLSGSGNQVLDNRIAGLHILQSENDTPPRAIEIFGSDHLIEGNVIGWDKSGYKIGVCGQGIKVSGSGTEIHSNIIIRSRLDSEDAEGAAILASDTSPLFGQISVRGNLVERGPGKVYSFGPGIPDTLKLFKPAQITIIDGLEITGTSGENSPCANCLIDLYRDDFDDDQEAFSLLGTAQADENGEFTFTLSEPLPDGQGIRTASTTSSSGVIGAFGANTSTRLSELYMLLEGVSVDGPMTGLINEQLSYAVTVTPTTSVELFTITVEATSVAEPLVLTSDSSASFNASWTTPGPKTIIITVDNGVDTVQTSFVVAITDPDPGPGDDESAVYLPFVVR